MLSRRRFRDKYDSWKKLFLQNWTLFKASRIGVVGLAIAPLPDTLRSCDSCSRS